MARLKFRMIAHIEKIDLDKIGLQRLASDIETLIQSTFGLSCKELDPCAPG